MNLGRGGLAAIREQFLAGALRRLELGMLTPSCCRLTFGIAPPRLGSGKFSTPWPRMQREKASGSFCCPDAAAALEGELLCLVVVVEPSCAT